MSKRLSTVMFVLISSCSAVSFAQSQTNHAVSMAIGEPGSESFVLGTELWAMTEIALKPRYGIELSSIEVADESERLAMLDNADVEVALVGGNVPTSLSAHMRTIMAIWPEGISPGTGNPAQILAHEDVADDVIYRITRAIFENANFFHGTKEEFNEIVLEQAITEVDLPIHPGASRYYEEMGISPNPALTQLVTEVNTAKFENFDDAALNDDERAQVAAACRQALDLGALSAMLGDLSSRGCEVYQSYLEDQRNARHDEASIGPETVTFPSGQGGPAIALNGIVTGEDIDVQALQGDHHQTPKPAPRQPTM